MRILNDSKNTLYGKGDRKLKLYCCWKIMNESQSLGIVTNTLEKAQEFKKKYPEYNSIYSVNLNEHIQSRKNKEGYDMIWGEWAE